MITNHNEALDEHARLLSSLSPMSGKDKMIRTSLVLSPLLTRVGDDSFDRLTDTVMAETGETNRIRASAIAMDKVFGKGYFNLELSSFIASEISTLRKAQTIFCTGEIVDEINEAKETMLDSIILNQDVFVKDGLIFLEKPYRFAVITRTPLGDGWQMEDFIVTAILFTETSDRVDKEGIAVQLYGHWHAVHFYEQEEKPSYDDKPYWSYVYNRETGLTESFNQDETSTQEELEIMRKYEDHFGQLFEDRAKGAPMLLDGTFFQYGETDTEYDKEVLDLKRFLLSFFRLTYEYLEVEKTRTERPFQKRAKRAGVAVPEDGYITVMTLRRKVYETNGDGETRNGPSYAFRVRGHWKKQYLPSRKLPVGNPGAYKHLYVKDYIKGRGIVVKSKRVVKVGD